MRLMALLMSLVTLTQVSAITQKPAAPSVHGRDGRVHLNRRVLVDDDGPFLALGASLFWALWGEERDPDRLDRNLAWLSERGVDFVRVLGMVGNDSWSDRRIDPNDPKYWDLVDALFARLARHGLRAEVTVFADSQVMMSSPSARRAFLERWAKRVEAEPHRVILLEIANEASSNGLGDLQELRRLGALANARTRVLTALSAVRTASMCAAYAKADVDVVTMHYERNRADGPWGSVSEPYRFVDEYDGDCNGQIKEPAWNNEPIGLDSSVKEESSPLRLVMGAVNTWLAGDPAYVFHAGAGIRGGGAADLTRGRKANWYDEPAADSVLRGIAAFRRVLPTDAPNWETTAAHRSTFPFDGFREAVDAGDLNRAHGALAKDGRFAVTINGLGRPRVVKARRAMTFDVRAGDTGEFIEKRTLKSGENWTVTPRPHDGRGDGLVLIGRF